MSQEDQAYSVEKLYEESFQIKFNWKEILPQHVFHFHDLFPRENNSPIDLQMGTILPFVTSCVGPHTKGLFLTQPSVLNLFWLNIGASGTGKSQARKKFISDPLEYMLSNGQVKIPDFEISHFTRAGKYLHISIENKMFNIYFYMIILINS